MKKFLKNIAKAIVKFAISTYCKIVYKVKILGTENIPKEGALIFCGNHRSYLDPVMIVFSSTREMRFMAKEELRKNPFLAALGNIFDVIYVKRDSKDITPLKESMKTLKNGGCIGIFPEGTRNGLKKNDGEIKAGAAHLALKTGAKVIPIGIVGELKPFTKNSITFGKPLDFSEYAIDKKISKENEEKVSNIIKEKILELAKIND